MKKQALAVAVAAASAFGGTAYAHDHGSDTSAWVRFNYSWLDATQTTKAVVLEDIGFENLQMMQSNTSGIDPHSTVTFGFSAKGDWYDHAFSVDLENFENSYTNHDNYYIERDVPVVDKDGKAVVDKDGKAVTRRERVGDELEIDQPYPEQASISANYRYRFDPFLLMGGESLSFGPLDRVLWSTKANWARTTSGQRKRWEMGPTWVFDVPGTSGLTLDTWYRDNLDIDGSGWHFALGTAVPFTVFGQNFSVAGNYEYVTAENSRDRDSTETEHLLNWHVTDSITAGVSYNTENVIGDGRDHFSFYEAELTYRF